MVVAEAPAQHDKRERIAAHPETPSDDEGDLVALDERAKLLDASIKEKVRLVSDDSPEGKKSVAELSEIQQEVRSVFSRATKAVSEVAGMPAEFVRKYFEAKRDKELQIPDNRKVINRIGDTLREVNRQFQKNNKNKQKKKFFVNRYSGEQFKQIEKMYAEFIVSNKQNLDRWDSVGCDLLGAIYNETLGVLSEIKDWEKIADQYSTDRDSISLSAKDNEKIDEAVELWRMSFSVDQKRTSHHVITKQSEVGSHLYGLVGRRFAQTWEPKKKQMEAEGRSNEEISKEQFKERNIFLLKYPEVAAKFYLNARYESNLTSEKQHEIFDILLSNEAGSLLLAEFNLKGGNLRPEKLTAEKRSVLFNAYLERAPHKIYWSADIFYDELNKLSEEEILPLIVSVSEGVHQPKPFVVAKLLSVVHISAEGYSELQKRYPQIGSPSELAVVNPLFALKNLALCDIKKGEEVKSLSDFTKSYSPHREVALLYEILKHPEAYSAEVLGVNSDLFFQIIGEIILDKSDYPEEVFDTVGLAIKSNLLSAPQLDSLRSLLLSDNFSVTKLEILANNISASFSDSPRVFNEKEHDQMVAMEYVYGINFQEQDTKDISESIRLVTIENAVTTKALIDLLPRVKGKEHADVIQKIADNASAGQFVEILSRENISSFSEEEKNILAKRAIAFGNKVALKLYEIDFDFVIRNYREDFLQSLTDLSFAYDVIRSRSFSDAERSALFLRVLKTANRDTSELSLLLNDYSIQNLSQEVKKEAIRALLNVSPQYIESMLQNHRSVMYENFLPEVVLHLGIESVFDLLKSDSNPNYIDKDEIAKYYLTTISNADDLNQFADLCFPKNNSYPKVRLSDGDIKIFIQKMTELGGESLELVSRQSNLVFQNTTEEQKAILFQRILEGGNARLVADLVYATDSEPHTYIKQHPELRAALDQMIFGDQLPDAVVDRLLKDERSFASLSEQQQERCVRTILESQDIKFVDGIIHNLYARFNAGVLPGFPNFSKDIVDHLFELSVQQKKSILLNGSVFSKLSEERRSVQYDIAIESKSTQELWDTLRMLDWLNFVVPKKVIDYLIENSDPSHALYLIQRQNHPSDLDSELMVEPARGFVLSSEQNRLIFDKIIDTGSTKDLLMLFDRQHKNLLIQDLDRMSEKILEDNDINDVIKIITSPTMESLFSRSEQANLVKKHLQKDDTANKIDLFRELNNNNVLSDQEINEYASLFIKDLFLENEVDPYYSSKPILFIMLELYSSLVKLEFTQLVSEQLDPDVRKRLLTRGSNMGILSFELLQEEVERNPTSISELLAVVKEIDASKFWEFAELIKQPNFSSRDAQLFMSLMVGDMINKDEYAIFDQYDLDQPESERLGKEIKDLVESYNIGDKGKTIVVLLFAREFGQTKDLKEFAAIVKEEILKYKKVLDTVGVATFPEGAKASIGMEYEVSDSIAYSGYVNATGSDKYKKHILQMSKYANIGQGNDAVHEIATQPTDNPYAMLLEMQLLQDLEFIDFNFEKDGFEKGSRGYHLTLGGERGLRANESMNILQNLLVMSGWGGVNAGKNVDIIAYGRGVNIRERGVGGAIRVFKNATPAVEFRSLSLDKKEPFERCVMTGYFGSVAIQTLEKFFPNISMDIGVIQNIIDNGVLDNPEKLYASFADILVVSRPYYKTATTEPTKQEKEIIFEWIRLVTSAINQTQDHNKNFYDTEAAGYIDEQDRWVDVEEFGGQQNASRFESVVADKKTTLEDYLNKTKINPALLFEPTSISLANSLTAINNLFLKPSESIGGDRANALAMLETTKFGNASMEDVKGRGLRASLVDTQGKGREGYYNLQGGSERMLVHAIQKAILTFDARMKDIIFTGKNKQNVSVVE